MSLSSDLISQFVKATKDDTKVTTETTVYGTIVYNGRPYVKLDGSDLLTPVSTTAAVKDGERVTVMIKDHTATVTGNISSPSASDKDVQEIGSQITEFETVIAYKVSAEELEAANATIESLRAKVAKITDLDVVFADIETLQAKFAELDYVSTKDIESITATIESLRAKFGDFTDISTEDLEALHADIDLLEGYTADFTYVLADVIEALKADIEDLHADKLSATDADIKYATITQLDAINADIDNLHADVADIDTLIFGSASGTTIHTSFANAVIAQLGNAQIKSAMIDSVSASKIDAGIINTNNVDIKSDDGRLLISDETIQISDDTRVRVQIGKDASGDYSISIWDADGNLMFSEGGITDNAIKDAIIRNDMVAPDANINASKLDISSLFTEINDSTETINAGRVYIDTDKQTLDVAFTQMSSDIDGLSSDVSSQGSQISVIQEQISSKIWQQDIKTATDELGSEIETLNTKQSNIEQTVDGISATVSSHESEIAKKADNSTVTTVSDKVSKLETDLDGFKSTVSSTYATQTSLSEAQAKVDAIETVTDDLNTNIETLNTKQSSIEQTVNGISATVSSHESEIAKKADNSTVTTVSDKVSKLETDLDGFKSTVTSNYVTGTQLAATDAKVNEASETANTALNTANTANANATTAQKAADAAQDDVDALAVRVTNAETAIEQNTEAIELRATKTELSTVSTATSRAQSAADAAKTTAQTAKASAEAAQLTANNAATSASNARSIANTVSTDLAQNYYDKTEVESKIKVSADGITATVEEKFTGLQIGGRNYIRNGKGDTKTGFFEEFETVETGYGELTLSSSGTPDNISLNQGFVVNCRDYEVGKEMVFSYDIMITGWDVPESVTVDEWWMGQRYTESSDGSITDNDGSITDGAWRPVTAHDLPKVGVDCALNEWIHVEKLLTIPEQAADGIDSHANIQLYNSNASATASVSIRLKNVKLEYGNKATDWTPAPEDMASAISVNERISQLEIENQSIELSVSSIETDINNLSEDLGITKQTVTEMSSVMLTSEKLTIEIDKLKTDGVSKVNTSTGYTFDDEGLTIDSTEAKTKTQVTPDGMTVYSKTSSEDEEVLTATSDGVDATNLHAKTYLIIGGRSRFENYGEDRTGCFWIGG